jgi:IS30 family transposase
LSEETSRGLLAGDSCRVIARRLGRAPSTVSRDVAAAGHRERSCAWRADETAHRRAHRPKIAKLIAVPRRRRAVERGLRRRWSPQHITARWVLDYPDDLEMRVSQETVSQSLFVQARGALRQELTRCLRTGRAQRRPLGRAPGSGQLPHMVRISERPADVEDRAVPGHWEGDRILGKRAQSAMGTVVER